MSEQASSKILIVEDEGIVAMDIQRRLERLGYIVVGPASSGREAIEVAGRLSPDLVLMDIKLKGNMDGTEAARQIRESFGVPVVYLTAYTDETTLKSARIAEPYGYVVKPFGDRDLHSTIEMALYKHRTEEQLLEKTRLNRTLLDSIPCAAFLVRPHTREVVALNQAAANAGAVPGKACYQIWGQRQTPCPWCLAPELWATGEAQRLEMESVGRMWDVRWLPVSDELYIHFILDVTDRKTMEAEREATIRLLGLIHASSHLHELMHTVTVFLRDWSGCEAVGIRLRDGEDFPYFETSGFEQEFIQAESKLCSVNETGQLVRDSEGRPYLECMCGNIICGRFDPSKPFFTEHGSFWTNGTTELLACTSEADRQGRTRNRCNSTGYESVALVPMRTGGETFGLLQFNSREKGRFTAEKVSLFERLADNIAVGLAQRQAESAFRESEEKYRQLFETEMDAIIIFDVETRKFIDVNDAAVRLYGYCREEFLRLTQSDITVEKEASDLSIRQTAAGLSTRIPLRHHKKRDGTVFPVEISGSSFALSGRKVMCGVIRDITERKNMEEELRKESHLRSTLLDNLPCVAMILKKGTREIVACNEGARGIGAVLGKTCYETCSERDDSCPWCLAPDVWVTGEPRRLEVEYRGVHYDALWVPLSEDLYVHYVFDITERKLAEQRVIADQLQLKSLASQLSRMEERERYRLATALHDQIGQSLVFSKLKLDELRTSDSSEELGRVLEEVCRCLGQVIQETRTLTSDLCSPILYELGFEVAVAEWLTDEIREKHGIETEFDDDGREKPLDDDIRAILFRNVRELLINVVKHAQARKVKVCVSGTDEDICVSVEDDGVGFDPAEAKATAAKSDKFGLFSIRQRLEQLGGLIEIDSESGRGCRISMKAPLKREIHREGI